MAETNNFTAATFSFEIVPNSESALTAAYWDGLDPNNMPLVTVQAGYVPPGGGEPTWNDLTVGRIDRFTYRPTTGTLSVTGRDRTADFIEAKTFEAYVNQTSSAVALVLAAAHGMQSQITATTTPIGRFFHDNHTKISLGQFSRVTTEWDLLVYLAQHEGFDVFVQANTLHFQPAEQKTADSYIVFCQPQANWLRSNGIELNLDRSMTLARDIEVVVQTWNSSQKAAFKVTARALGAKGATKTPTKPGSSPTQQYVLVRPNLTHDQAQKLANQTLSDLSKHERTFDMRMPGEFQITPRTKLTVQGTRLSWDQDYFTSTISRDFSMQGGFTQNVRGKNISPRLTETVG